MTCKKITFALMLLAAVTLAAGSAQAVTIDMLNVKIGGHPHHQGRNKYRWGYMENAFGAGTWLDVRANGRGPTRLSYKHSVPAGAGGLGVDSRGWRYRPLPVSPHELDARRGKHQKGERHKGWLPQTDGEIDYGEKMLVRFSEPVTLNSVDLAFLDYERNWFTGQKYHERGYLRIYRKGQRPLNLAFGGGPSPYFRVSDNDGIYSLLFQEMSGVKAIRFFAWKPHLGETHNYAVHGFHVNAAATPEPGTMLLLGSAMGMLGFITRKRRPLDA